MDTKTKAQADIKKNEQNVQNKDGKTAKKTTAKKNTGKKQQKGFVTRLKTFFTIITDEQQLAEMTYGRPSRKIINFIKIFIASWQKFNEDDCFTKSTAITYSTLISLIPTLTVALTFASIFMGVGAQKDELFLQLTKFLAMHNLQHLNITPILDAISGLVDNAASIGGVGAAVLIFSATAVLRTIEQSLNKIWKVTKQRPLFLKIIYYWAALTLGPIMLFVGTTLAAQLSTTLSPPDYNQTLFQQNQIWIAGSKATAGIKPGVHKKIIPINTDLIDFENQYIYEYDRETNTMSRDIDSVFDLLEFKKLTFNDISVTGSTIRIAGEKGILITSNDNGKSWDLAKLSNFNINDMYMFDAQNGVLICDNGMMMTTVDGGINWIPYPIPDFTQNLHSVIFEDGRGFIVADKGYLLTSFQTEEGIQWELTQLQEAKIKKYFSSLNDIKASGKSMLITGDDGLILISRDSGRSWQVKNLKMDNYTAGFIESTSSFYIGSDNGKLLHTNDGGTSWDLIEKTGQKINTIYKDGDKIQIAGGAGLYMQTLDNGLTWEGKSGKSLAFTLLNFFAPFAVIWLLFLLMYTAMPNIKIPIKPAAIGASFTGAVWVAFIFLFMVYVQSFANGTFAIYGALAAFPLFLLLIYASTLIILFGGELAYTIMYPATYRNLKKKQKIHDFTAVVNGVRILYHVYKKFESGKGGSSQDELQRITQYRIAETDFFIEQFMQNSMLLYKENSYYPANSSRNITIESIVNTIHNFKIDALPPGSDPVRRLLGDKFMQMGSAIKEILKNDTLHDLINEKADEA